jgi:nitrogen PTS system EIIA component
MHFGSTLRLLRLDVGLTLRELADRVGVSNAYLSRVENGHDAPPTPDRLAAIARAFRLPPATLIALAHRVGPYTSNYLARIPAARELLLEMERRRLGQEEIAQIREFIQRQFPSTVGEGVGRHWVDGMCAPERVVLRLSCGDIDDVIDVAATRLSAPLGMSAAKLGDAMRGRENACPTGLGGGFAVPHAIVGGQPLAVVVTLRTPIAGSTPDGEPLGLLVVHVHPGGADHTRLLTRMARLADPKTVGAVCAQPDARRVLAVLRRAAEDQAL